MLCHQIVLCNNCYACLENILDKGTKIETILGLPCFFFLLPQTDIQNAQCNVVV